jgi:hypothetical protein
LFERAAGAPGVRQTAHLSREVVGDAGGGRELEEGRIGVLAVRSGAAVLGQQDSVVAKRRGTHGVRRDVDSTHAHVARDHAHAEARDGLEGRAIRELAGRENGHHSGNLGDERLLLFLHRPGIVDEEEEVDLVDLGDVDLVDDARMRARNERSHGALRTTGGERLSERRQQRQERGDEQGGASEHGRNPLVMVRRIGPPGSRFGSTIRALMHGPHLFEKP